MTTQLPTDKFANIPASLKNLRACKRCYLVKEFDDFYENGCDNCESYLNMAGNTERINDCTSLYFDGLIGMCYNKESWVASYQRINSLKSGMYAIQVTGNFPESIQQELRDQQVYYPKNLD